MRITITPTRAIELVQGDITRESVDAIVNAANPDLLPGGGVCGAIHRAGGPEIAEECRRIRQEKGPVRTGSAVATMGGKLSRHVIHAVGPVWQGGRQGEPEALAGCYRQSLRIADGLKLQSIAFPAISTGIFGYPVAEAAEIALKAVADSLPALQYVERVRFVLFDQSTFDAFIAAARRVPAAS
ncbi:MAG TPA: O-acetyl-ADP-ribose deacetylase [Terriglobales bacterium]|nr:O-acetyl-ADP-ribose deacetylase [Terriglobales bacterium]